MTRQGKIGFALVAAAFFINMLGTTLPTPLYPLYETRYGIAPLLVTVIFATYAVAVVAGLLFFGRQSDRVGRRPVLAIGIVLSALSAIAFLFARDVGVLLIGRFISGLSAGVFTGAGTAALVDFASAERRRIAAIVAIVANLGGLACGTLCAGALAQYAADPLRLPFAVDLVLTFAAAACLFAAPETVRSSDRRLRFEMQKLHVPEEIRVTFAGAAIAGMSAFAVSGVFSAVAPVLLARELRPYPPLSAGALVFLLFGASCAGQLVVERLPRRRAFTIGGALLAIGLIALGASIALQSATALFVSAALCGVGQGLVMGFGLANVNDRVEPKRRGEVTSTYFVLLYIALAIPVVGVGLLATRTGLATAGLAFSAAVFVAVLVAIGVTRSAGER